MTVCFRFQVEGRMVVKKRNEDVDDVTCCYSPKITKSPLKLNLYCSDLKMYISPFVLKIRRKQKQLRIQV